MTLNQKTTCTKTTQPVRAQRTHKTPTQTKDAPHALTQAHMLPRLRHRSKNCSHEEITGLPERVGPNPGDGERGGSRGEAPCGTVVTRACEGAKGEER